jgi:hypothetical protein
MGRYTNPSQAGGNTDIKQWLLTDPKAWITTDTIDDIHSFLTWIGTINSDASKKKIASSLIKSSKDKAFTTATNAGKKKKTKAASNLATLNTNRNPYDLNITGTDPVTKSLRKQKKVTAKQEQAKEQTAAREKVLSEELAKEKATKKKARQQAAATAKKQRAEEFQATQTEPKTLTKTPVYNLITAVHQKAQALTAPGSKATVMLTGKTPYSDQYASTTAASESQQITAAAGTAAKMRSMGREFMAPATLTSAATQRQAWKNTTNAAKRSARLSGLSFQTAPLQNLLQTMYQRLTYANRYGTVRTTSYDVPQANLLRGLESQQTATSNQSFKDFVENLKSFSGLYSQTSVASTGTAPTVNTTKKSGKPSYTVVTTTTTKTLG